MIKILQNGASCKLCTEVHPNWAASTIKALHMKTELLTLLLGRIMTSPWSMFSISFSHVLKSMLWNAGCAITRLMYAVNSTIRSVLPEEHNPKRLFHGQNYSSKLQTSLQGEG
jgi:hypothetical protein